MRRVLLVVGLLLVLLCPVSAYASPIDGFTNGLNDFFEPSEVSSNRDGVEGGLLAAPNANSDTYLKIKQTVNNGMRFRMDGAVYYTQANYWQGIRDMLVKSNIVKLAVLLVFMWWGVRKVIRIIFAAFRSGE